jgi:hypothetical protein
MTIDVPNDPPRPPRARRAIALATGLVLLGAAFAFTPLGQVVAQFAAPSAHQYVVGVSGMH